MRLSGYDAFTNCSSRGDFHILLSPPQPLTSISSHVQVHIWLIDKTVIQHIEGRSQSEEREEKLPGGSSRAPTSPGKVSCRGVSAVCHQTISKEVVRRPEAKETQHLIRNTVQSQDGWNDPSNIQNSRVSVTVRSSEVAVWLLLGSYALHLHNSAETIIIKLLYSNIAPWTTILLSHCGITHHITGLWKWEAQLVNTQQEHFHVHTLRNPRLYTTSSRKGNNGGISASAASVC